MSPLLPSPCWHCVCFEPVKALCMMSQSEFWCAWKTLFPWRHPPPLALPLFLPPLPQRPLSLEGRLVKPSHLGLRAPKSLTSAHCPVAGLCVSYYYQKGDDFERPSNTREHLKMGLALAGLDSHSSGGPWETLNGASESVKNCFIGLSTS